MNRLPYEIREAMVTALGKVFWLKDPFRAFLLAAGVPREVFDRYAEEPKFKIARHVLAELDAQGDAGWLIQRRLLSELCRLRRIPDPTVEDRDGALFFSIAGYRAEVVMDFMRGGTTNVVLFDGSDVALILEGQMSFTDALQLKIEKAAQEGLIYFPLSQR